MSVTSGACLVTKVSGMIHIKEDTTPSVLEWKAIDQLKIITIPLRDVQNLQATKDNSPKIILNVIYKGEKKENESLKLSFSNRPTMNNIKEALKTILARSKTLIDTVASGATQQKSEQSDPLLFDSSESLSDSSLLKNLQLQQKLLMEDKKLRNIFTQSVMKFKLAPVMFWSSRINQLRTFALTISQHKGPYNVLSFIKPVATSDNQVNVKVSRTTINEIFETYPVVKKAFHDCVPQKFGEGEFWSRFFNSRLFRRLRGDKITSGVRGDNVLDSYLNEAVEDAAIGEVSKIIDLQANEEDHSETLGNGPDMTMKFTEDKVKDSVVPTDKPIQVENELVILLRNMNNLSKKMLHMHSSKPQTLSTNERPNDLSSEELREYKEELDLHDLHEEESMKFVKLNIREDFIKGANHQESIKPEQMSTFLIEGKIPSGPIDLKDLYVSKLDAIDASVVEINSLVAQNARLFRGQNVTKSTGNNVLSDQIIQDLISYNVTIVEFLSHFWKLYLTGTNFGQFKKIFGNIRGCKAGLDTLKDSVISTFDQHPSVKDNAKIKERLIKDFNMSIQPLEDVIAKAYQVYADLVKYARELSEKNNEKNENGKRPLS